MNIYVGVCKESISGRLYFIYQLIVAQWRHMMTYIWFTNGLGNNLLLDGTKQLPESLLTPGYWYSSQDNVTENSQDMIAKISYKINSFKLFVHLPGDNDLHLYPNSNGVSAKTPLKLGHEWVIKSYSNPWIWSLFHSLIPVNHCW